MDSKKLLLPVFLSCLLCLAAATYENCGNGSEVGSLVSLQISDCNNDDSRCVLKKNTNASISISFTTTEESDTLTSVVHGVILGVAVPFPLPNPNGCKDSGVSCPIKGGQTYHYITTLPVRSEYPKVTVDVKWELQGKDGKDIVCILIPSKIK